MEAMLSRIDYMRFLFLFVLYRILKNLNSESKTLHLLPALEFSLGWDHRENFQPLVHDFYPI